MAKNRISEVFGTPVFTPVARAASVNKKTGNKFRVLAEVVIPIKNVDPKVINGIRGQVIARQAAGSPKAKASFAFLSSFYQPAVVIPSSSASEMAEYETQVTAAYIAWSKETGNVATAIDVPGVELDSAI